MCATHKSHVVYVSPHTLQYSCIHRWEQGAARVLGGINIRSYLFLDLNVDGHSHMLSLHPFGRFHNSFDPPSTHVPHHHQIDRNGVLYYAVIEVQCTVQGNLQGECLGVRLFCFSHGCCSPFCRCHELSVHRHVDEVVDHSVVMLLISRLIRSQGMFSAIMTGVVFGPCQCRRWASVMK